jgi:cysteine desulfurase
MQPLIYLDNHATTPLDPAVLAAMMPFFTTEFGNASSKSHAYGWKAEFAVEKSREQVAHILGAHPKEIVFTSGATESNNTALLGIAEKAASRGKHIITSQIEHKCILETGKFLAGKGFDVTFLPVDAYGQVQPAEVEKAIRPDTILLSVMLANNEVGTINPVAEIGAIARRHNVFFHTDAAQAVGKIPVNVDAMNIDLLSLSAHKLYGPKGVGALYVRRKNPQVTMAPLMHGGGQEHGLRSGTLNVPGIVGLGSACEIAENKLAAELHRVTALRARLYQELQKNIGELHLNGHPTNRLPQSLNVSFPFVESDSLVASLKNIAVSSTSACMSASAMPSYVLAAMGVEPERIHGSIRFGLGRFTTEEEISYTIEAVSKAVKELQEASPLYQLQRTNGKK